MAATMLSSMLATTHCFPSQNPNRGSGNRKSCRSSSSPACFYPSTVRYQDRFSAFRPSTFPSFCAIRGHLYRMGARRSTSRIFLPHLVASIEEVEETYVMVKPDGVQRGLVGDIISRFEKKGFLLKGLKLFQCPKELAEEHYKELKDKSFYPKLIKYITSGPVVCMAWEGIGVVASARKLIGATNPLQADPGTIRGDLAVQTGRNVVHGSDSPDNGHREIDLWFKQDELCEWVPAQEPWLKE
ncbi:uncharacterized protein LOC110098618 [Dendrobium catenatum]|uniref:Nucleoside diphosphate kinase n=1 Tax=Dendrobium catenatum TaxID=906689 RepID=A0A2I0XEV2_9ASPA|nr:uncharacterized protein LOC110098618 [Dendrobium catenatum]PKU86447.1 Nucleoside diphosphate kinase 2, chloroplastic [Dendrobium catenatum]